MGQNAALCGNELKNLLGSAFPHSDQHGFFKIHILLSTTKHFMKQGYYQSTLLRLLMPLRKKLFENIVGKEENAGNKYFLPFLQTFPPYHEIKS